MKRMWILLVGTLLCADTIDCTKVFEERKGELLREVEKIDEARQSFEALKAATNALFEKQKNALKEKENSIAKTKQELEEKEKQIAQMLEENKKLLDQVQAKKGDKLDETYIKMKDAAAAAIVEKLPIHEGAAIMFGLPAKKVSQIMAKMNPQVASEITQQLKKGPPFVENNQTKE
ncbi:MotE family protein [Sulfurospirillum sp.]|jgi:flagellar motility protein MotE (MotC chaperone)|uniref:MotE family protein n=1 Tax=Sulfurospirillum sp. TaxID=2053622 RepID=UPI002FDD2C58